MTLATSKHKGFSKLFKVNRCGFGTKLKSKNDESNSIKQRGNLSLWLKIISIVQIVAVLFQQTKSLTFAIKKSAKKSLAWVNKPKVYSFAAIIFLCLSSFVFLIKIPNAQAAPEIIASYTFSGGDYTEISNYYLARYQAFNVTEAISEYHNITSVDVKLSQRNNPTGLIVIEIWNLTGTYGIDATPDTLLAQSEWRNASTLTGVYPTTAVESFTFNSSNQIGLYRYSQYMWVIRCTSEGFDAENTIKCYMQIRTTGDYGGDFGYSANGEAPWTWEGSDTYNRYFVVYGESNIQPTYAPTIVSASYNQTVAGNSTLFTVTANMTDGGYLSNAWIETNATGTLENKTAVAMSGSYQSVNDTVLMPNVGDYITSRWHVNSTTGNITASNWINFTLNALLYGNLKVTGNQILNVNGTAISLNGWNYDISLDYSEFSYISPDGTIEWSSYDVDAIDTMLKAIKADNASCIRLLIVVDWLWNNTNNYRDNILNFSRIADVNGLYVELCPYKDNADTAEPFSDLPWFISDNVCIHSAEEFAYMWGNFSYWFKDEPNILFYLWNEPQAWLNQTYFDGVQLAVNAIRATDATNIIIISNAYGLGLDFGWMPTNWGLSWIETYPIIDSNLNLAYSFHLYAEDFYNSSDSYNRVFDAESLDFALDYLEVYDMTTKYPLICGEIGLYVGATNQTKENLWFSNMLNLLGNHSIVGVQQWTWRSSTGYRALNNTAYGETTGNYALSIGGLEFVDWLGGLSYSLDISSVSPEESSTLESDTLNFEFTTTGNDTISETQVALYYSNYTQAGTNQTSLTGAFNDLVNETYIIACTVTGVNGATDYLEVPFTVAIPPDTYIISITPTNPQNATYPNSTIPNSATLTGNGTSQEWHSNVMNLTSSTYLYAANLTSTNTTVTIAVNGTYRMDYWASDAEGSTDTDSVTFTIAITEETIFNPSGAGPLNSTPTPTPSTTTPTEPTQPQDTNSITLKNNPNLFIFVVAVIFILIMGLLVATKQNQKQTKNKVVWKPY
jgi:hypothetical protein